MYPLIYKQSHLTGNVPAYSSPSLPLYTPNTIFNLFFISLNSKDNVFFHFSESVVKFNQGFLEILFPLSMKFYK